MKKFSFSLDHVLNYKNQMLDHLMNEHAGILLEIRQQEALIEAIKEQYVVCSDQLRDEQRLGVTVMQIYSYKNYLDVLTYRVQKEQEVLGILRRKEEHKRYQVVEAKKESASIDKLKEKKIDVYQKELQKEEERLIEEFVSNARNKRQHQAG